MNLIDCLKENGMMIPNYNDLSIVDLVREIYKYCGYEGNVNFDNKDVKKYIKRKKHIVFILADGMGSNLINSLQEDNLLRKYRVSDMQTVCPTSTGCVLSTIATAQYPAIHGMIGWYNYNRKMNTEYYTLLFKERKSKKDLYEFGINSKDIYVCKSIMNKLNRKTVAFFPNNIVDSEFSKFTLEKNRRGYENISDAFEQAYNNIKENVNNATFTYIYLPQVDSESHRNGVFSQATKNIIDEIERNLVMWKEQKDVNDIEVIITADHGQIDITEKDIIMDFEKYNKYFYALPAIDFGTATYYVKKENEAEFLRKFKKDYRERMYIFKTEEYIKNGFFGKKNVSNYLIDNLGEYISFCKKGAYFVNTDRQQEEYIGKIKGNHSGFSEEEIKIPLIVIDI